MAHYRLRCYACGSLVENAYLPRCTCSEPSLIVPEYRERSFVPGNRSDPWKFIDWLPVMDIPRDQMSENDIPITAGHSTVFSPTALSSELDLPNLHCALTGYWPERGAFAHSGTFKELEAHPTLQRAHEFGVKGLVIASAGNTARAFLQNGWRYGIQIVVVVPESALHNLWIPASFDENAIRESATIIAVRDADYFDAISVAGKLDFLEGFYPEGGAMNIARRDGMGTVMLEYAHSVGRVPEFYFQAVGSGTGAIAALEVARRLRLSGNFGDRLPELHLAQNLPFVPMVEAWNAHTRDLSDVPSLTDPMVSASAHHLYASMLSNRKPPYGIIGGVFDCLKDSGGSMYAVSEKAARDAGSCFSGSEGIDLAPESEVTLAALIRAHDTGSISRDDSICVNLTGGGAARLKNDIGIIHMKPDIVVTDVAIGQEELEALLK